MKKKGNRGRWFPFILLLVPLFFCLTPSWIWAGRISPEFREQMRALPPGTLHPVILRFLEPSPIDKSLLKGKPKSFRNKQVVSELRKASGRTQRSLLMVLEERQKLGKAAKIKSLWIVNAITLMATEDLLEELAADYPDLEILPDQAIPLGATPQGAPGPAEWNLEKIHAPDLWDLGYKGQGVVVAVLDTGVDVYHPDLAGRYLGGSNSWFDPYSLLDPEDPLYEDHPTPVDIHYVNRRNDGHGTPVMGILVGGDASGKAIGVAPEARWMAAKIFPDSEDAVQSHILTSLQWALDPDGDPSTDDAPDIVNNSWGETRADSSCNSLFQDAVRVIRDAGIFPVFASGNSGYAVLPAAYPESVAVGSTDLNDVIDESQSGHGTTACRSNPATYPDLVAPGEGIRSAGLTFEGLFTDPVADADLIYMDTLSGTSFAAPHVAGAAALLLSAYPNLSVDQVAGALRSTAADLGSAGADNVSGYGRIDVKAAFDYLTRTLSLPASPPEVQVKNMGVGTLKVTWAPSPGAVTYTVSRNGTVMTSGLTENAYTDSSVTDSGSYTYAVLAALSSNKSEPSKGLLGNIHRGNTITENRVDAFDLARLMRAFGTSPGDPKWDEAADLNGDNRVDSLDRTILTTHFGQVIR